MNEYRAYIVGTDGHFESYRGVRCADDSEAVIWAKQLLDGQPVELWSGARFVVRLDSQGELVSP
jgi:hypothetical protein